QRYRSRPILGAYVEESSSIGSAGKLMRLTILGGKGIVSFLVGDRIAGGNQVPCGRPQNREHRRLIVILRGCGESFGRLRCRTEGLLAGLLCQGCPRAAKPKCETDRQEPQSQPSSRASSITNYWLTHCFFPPSTISAHDRRLHRRHYVRHRLNRRHYVHRLLRRWHARRLRHRWHVLRLRRHSWSARECSPPKCRARKDSRRTNQGANSRRSPDRRRSYSSSVPRPTNRHRLPSLGRNN